METHSSASDSIASQGLGIPEGIIDMHCHILPGVDDGSRSMDESLELLTQAYRQGVVACIATPHYSRRSRDRDRAKKQSALCLELEERAREQIHPDYRIFFGQETYYHEELVDRIDGEHGWTMAASRYALIEFDTVSDEQTIHRGLRQLQTVGLTPILAHMERYPSIRKPGIIQDLKSMGVVFQMNYESLLGGIFNREARWCREQVLQGVIDLLGTDMHRVDFRPPRITETVDWLGKQLSPEHAYRLVRGNVERILSDEPMRQ